MDGLRPAGNLRPLVRCSTQKYNYRLRLGRGFSLDELKAVKLTAQGARSVGIAVDVRRKNKSEEGLQQNVERLQEYLSRLVVLPKNNNQLKQGPGGIPKDTARSAIEGSKLVAVTKEAFPVPRHTSILVSQ